MNNSVEMTVPSIKNHIQLNGAILGVDFSAVEMLGAYPDRKLKCLLYKDFGNLIPTLVGEGEFSESVIKDILSACDKIWISDDYAVADDGTLNFGVTTIRFFAFHEPNRVRWMTNPD